MQWACPGDPGLSSNGPWFSGCHVFSPEAVQLVLLEHRNTLHLPLSFEFSLPLDTRVRVVAKHAERCLIALTHFRALLKGQLSSWPALERVLLLACAAIGFDFKVWNTTLSAVIEQACVAEAMANLCEAVLCVSTYWLTSWCLLWLTGKKTGLIFVELYFLEKPSKGAYSISSKKYWFLLFQTMLFKGKEIILSLAEVVVR